MLNGLQLFNIVHRFAKKGYDSKKTVYVTRRRYITTRPVFRVSFCERSETQVKLREATPSEEMIKKKEKKRSQSSFFPPHCS